MSMLMVTELLWIMMVFIFFCIVVCIFQIFYNLQDLFILRENHIIIEQKKKKVTTNLWANNGLGSIFFSRIDGGPCCIWMGGQ